ncbi:hypothetical protein MNBD_DELTA01-221 [hydrothermal vent metagenome]|uniref:Uncharacterized protein n=1 Tax=hydrothermal vent metagenome TaxID=652676 RepID=A0A3B0QXV8_9ZZZZ
MQLEFPTKQVFSDPDDSSDFRVMPCIVRGKEKVRKTVKIVGANTLLLSVRKSSPRSGQTPPIYLWIRKTACVLEIYGRGWRKV